MIRWAMVFEGITSVVSLICVILVLKQNFKELKNKLMAFSLGMVGCSTLSVFIYDSIQQEWAVYAFAPISILAIFFSVTGFYLTVQLLIHSEFWWEKSINWVLPLFLCVAYTFVLFIWNPFTIVSLEPYVNTSVDILFLIPALLLIIGYLTFSLFQIYFSGIKQTTGAARFRLILVFSGISVSLFSVIVNILGQLLATGEYGYMWDIGYFFCVMLGMIILAMGFILKSVTPISSEENINESKPKGTI